MNQIGVNFMDDNITSNAINNFANLLQGYSFFHEIVNQSNYRNSETWQRSRKDHGKDMK